MRQIALVLLVVATTVAADDLTVYDDALSSGFQDWSWATHDLANPSPVVLGSLSISMEPDAWSGLYFYTPTAIDVAEYSQVRFWIFGDDGGGQTLRITLQLGASSLGDLALDPAPVDSWQQRTVDFADLGLTSGIFDGLILQDTSGGDQATVYFDQIELLENSTPPPPATEIAVLVSPDADRHPISPLIYGVNFGDPTQLADLAFPLRRWGGNSTTRYNWRFDISNRASDWFFQNIPNSNPDPTQLPDGSAADVFIDETMAVASQALLTAPIIGWVPRDERVKQWSFSVAKYGPQLLTECSYFTNPPAWCSDDAGDGTCDPAVNTTGYCSADGEIVGNDVTDTCQVSDPTWVSDWMTHIAARVGSAGQGGPGFWALDNEPMLFNSTHRDVHPTPLTYDEIWSRTVDYASAIKTQDPDAKVLGPVVWGWCAYFSSAADADFPNGSCVDGPDRQAHGGLPFVEWYLDQVCQHEAATGLRLIDYLDVHFYPQGNVSGLGGASSSEDPATAARRLRSVKELWDPSYVSESWIAEPVALIPRLRDWIDSRCPGIGIAITEYKWGPDDGPTGALAQAEVLAVLGREGVDLATRWVAPDPGSRSEDAFRLYLDPDGSGTPIAGHSVRAVSADNDAVGAYAIRGTGGILHVLLFNKQTTSYSAQVTVEGELEGTADVYRFDGANPLAWVESFSPQPDGFSTELPPRSATLVVTLLNRSLLFADNFESGDTSAWQ